MTAAVAPGVAIRTAPADHSRPNAATPPSGPDGGPGGAAGRRTGRTPYLTPVPASEPPFDDELVDCPAALVRPGRHPGRPVDLARATAPPAGPWATPGPSEAPGTAPADLKLTGTAAVDPTPQRLSSPTTITAAGVPHWSSEADVGVRKTATQHLPPAQPAAWVLARALVEVLSGRRPVAQLRVHCAPDIYEGLLQRPFAGHRALPHVLSVRVCEPADGVAEVSVAFRRSERVRAMAFRVQGVDGRWRITALQLG